MDNVIPIHGRQAKKLAEELASILDGKDLATVLEAIGIISQGLCVTIEQSAGYAVSREYKEDLLSRILEYTKDY